MKTFIRGIILFIVISNTARSQTWCPPGAVWNYTVYSWTWTHFVGYNEVRYVDTITLYGRLCQYFTVYTFEHYVNLGGYTQNDHSSVVTSLNNQVLTYMSSPGQFDTIAIFNAAPGAHWYKRSYPVNSTTVMPTRYTVKDTGHATINGFSLKYLDVGIGDSISVFTDTCTSCTLRIYERIGPVQGFMHPISIPDIIDAGSNLGTFGCYYDNEFPPYSVNGYKCNINRVGVNEQTFDSELTIYPNPSSGVFELEYDFTCDYSVFSTEGDLLIASRDVSNGSKIDLRDYPPGLYFLHISSGNHSEVRTLVKLLD